MKKHIYRVGDTVRIVTPEVFVRVGYPMTRQMVMDAMTAEDRKRIDDLAVSFGLKPGWPEFNGNPTEFSVVTSDIADRLAYHMLKRDGFGGTERRIYTQTKEEIRHRLFCVNGKRCVVTGKYERGYRSYDGTYDCQSALRGAETHVLLAFNGYEIEACHVESATDAIPASFGMIRDDVEIDWDKVVL